MTGFAMGHALVSEIIEQQKKDEDKYIKFKVEVNKDGEAYLVDKENRVYIARDWRASVDPWKHNDRSYYTEITETMPELASSVLELAADSRDLSQYGEDFRNKITMHPDGTQNESVLGEDLSCLVKECIKSKRQQFSVDQRVYCLATATAACPFQHDTGKALYKCRRTDANYITVKLF